MDKKSLSESDVCSKYITPALITSHWSEDQIRREFSFTKGRIKVKGKTIARWQAKRADYILYYNNHLPIAIIEAKDNTKSLWSGMQQWLEYAEALDIPFVYSSNGDGFLEHDRTKNSGTIEKELSLSGFPNPEALYERYKIWKWVSNEIVENTINTPYYDDWSGKEPRYYQRVAINRTIEAVANGMNRILLVMATGTGKTYTAFQIIWRLWKSRQKKRILFLADRNILVDQTMSNDFKPFGDKMTKIQHKQVDKSYEIYLALYQSITGNEEQEDLFRQFSPDFFDLIIIDECHRGSAKENSAWRDVLTYFSWATQIGLTATPKETEDVSTQTYFWEPIYTYSLKQGIDDGFLAPYKVMRVGMSIDDGWRPFAGQTDIYGNEIEDRIYNNKDFDKTLILKERTELVAQKITQFLKNTDRFAKTIVFCVDIDHAERMRQALVNLNSDLVAENSKYVMRITGDNPEWKMELDNFINPKEKYPTIVTTSKLMTTGVDAQTCKVIVLDTVINSMTEFKQIVGRWTRVNEAYGKYYFTIIDFRQATNNFADPTFDGEPVVIYNPKEDEELDDSGEFWVEDENAIIEGIDTVIPPPDETGGQRKTYVDGVRVEVVNERVQYIWGDGKLITESMKDYTKKNILRQYTSLDSFLKDWNEAEKKEAIIEALEEKGIFFEELQKETGKELDPFDIICHIAFDRPPLTRKERANNVKKRDYFSKYGDQAREVLELLLQKYADSGIESIEDIGVLRVDPLSRLGSPLEILARFWGKKENYIQAIKELEEVLYSNS